MSVLVTGGAGYIGSVVTAKLVSEGRDVVVFDNLSRGHRKAVCPGAALVVGDLADRSELQSVIDRYKVESVMHFAASSEAGESMRRPEMYFRNNVAGTLTLLEVMLSSSIRKIVFSSTAAVYGNPITAMVDETHPLSPTNAYGESKLIVERILDWFGRIHKFRYACLRYFNAAGATEELGEHHLPESHLIPNIINASLDGSGSVSIFGTDLDTPDGTCVRDYIHVSDLADAHILTLDALEYSETLTYNLGNGSGYSVREVIEAAQEVTSRMIDVKHAARRLGDPARLVANSSKVCSELGWQPKHSDLRSIVESAFSWRLHHPDGYGSKSAK